MLGGALSFDMEDQEGIAISSYDIGNRQRHAGNCAAKLINVSAFELSYFCNNMVIWEPADKLNFGEKS